MSKKTLLAAAIIVIVLLVGSTIYFIAQSSRLSTQLVQVSAIVRETAKNKVVDNEYYLRREYTRIQATDDQIAGLRILTPEGSETQSLADFAVKGNDDGRRLYYLCGRVLQTQQRQGRYSLCVYPYHVS